MIREIIITQKDIDDVLSKQYFQKDYLSQAISRTLNFGGCSLGYFPNKKGHTTLRIVQAKYNGNYTIGTVLTRWHEPKLGDIFKIELDDEKQYHIEDVNPTSEQDIL